MNFFKKSGIIISSIFITAFLLYLLISISAMIISSFGIQPPPPFDVEPNGISFSNFPLQAIYLIGIFLAPIIGSLIAYFLNGKKKTIIVYLPIIVFYLLYTIFLLRIYL